MDNTITPRVPEYCIMFATADWDDPYWTNKQHCARSLAEIGTRVLYVESVGIRSPSLSSKRDWQRLWSRARKGLFCLLFGAKERSPGISVLSPLVVPSGHNHFILGWLNRFMMRLSLMRSTHHKTFLNSLIWTYHPYMLDTIEYLKPSRVLYHSVDDLAAVPGVDSAAFLVAEAKLLQRADVVFVTSKKIEDHCRSINPNTYFLPNVVDYKHFGKSLQPGRIPLDLKSISEPRLCYHGVLSDFKIDFKLLLESARITPNWSWVFIGGQREGQKNPLIDELARLKNVHFLGYKTYDTLPDYLRGIQVGLLPSLINDYTRSMFPMKYFEYLAAGLPIASTPLEFSEYQSCGLQIGATAEEFINAISVQLSRGKINKSEINSLLFDNSWENRLNIMLSFL